MSTPIPVCTSCLRKRTNPNPRYRTCDECRARARAHRRIQQQPVIRTRNNTHIPENAVPPNPPPNFNPFQNSIRLKRQTPLRGRGDPFTSANPPLNFKSFQNFIHLPRRIENRILAKEGNISTTLSAIQSVLPRPEDSNASASPSTNGPLRPRAEDMKTLPANQTLRPETEDKKSPASLSVNQPLPPRVRK